MIRSGETHTGTELTIYEPDGQQYRVHCTELLESGPGFDRFIYERVQNSGESS